MRRKDLGLLVLVGFLFAALTFNLGMYLGIKWGLNHTPVAQGHQAPAHPHDPHATTEVKHDAPAPEHSSEQDWHTKKQIPQDLRDAFVKSKQSALIESQLRAKDRTPVGTSIADAETYFKEKKLPWGEPAHGGADHGRSIASEAPKAVIKTPKQANGLFERSPASVKSFAPTPGQVTVQVASYATEDEAVARVKSLVANGITDAYFAKTKVKSETWFQVSVGSYKDAMWAKKMGERMVRRNIASEYFVRKVPE